MDVWGSGAALQEVEALMAARAGDDDILGPIARQHLATGGKRLRARLALGAGAALAASEAASVIWAAACELAHNATLIHDDLQDGDAVRRGAPTVWVRHGQVQAINAGDLLLMLPFTLLHDLEVQVAGRLSTCMARHMEAVIRGQARECDMTARGAVERSHYEQTIVAKTAALFELPVFGAALLSGRDAAAAAELTHAFAPLGMLFQMQDDVLDLFGDKGRDAPGSDLREGKVSALVVEHLALHPADRAWLLGLLRLPRAETPAADVTYAIERFAEGGALRAVLQRIALSAAESRAKVAPPLAPLMQQLTQLVLAPIAHLQTS